MTAWTQHTAPDGRTYYYNAELKKSSWTRPADFLGGPANTPRPRSAPAVWEQHRAPDGRAYFYNRATKQSKWTLPEGATIISKSGAVVSVKGPTTTASQGSSGAKINILNTAVDSILRGLVVKTPACATPTDAPSLISQNARSPQPSPEKIEERFFSMFESSSVLSIEPQSSQTPPTFDVAMASLSAHPTWSMVSTDDERRALFYRWVDKKREEERQAGRRRLLEYLEGCEWITVRTTWKQALDTLEGVDEFDGLSKYDRVDIFDALMSKVEARSVQSQLVQDEIQQQKERQRRVALRHVLKDHFLRGIIHAKLTWKEYLSSAGGQEACDAIRDVEANTSGSRPRDLFMDIIEEAEILYEKDLPIIARIAAEGPKDADTIRKCLGDNVAEASIRLFLLEDSSREDAGSGGIRKKQRT